MRKSIIFGGSILCLFILLMIPNISAVEHKVIIEDIEHNKILEIEQKLNKIINIINQKTYSNITFFNIPMFLILILYHIPIFFGVLFVEIASDFYYFDFNIFDDILSALSYTIYHFMDMMFLVTMPGGLILFLWALINQIIHLYFEDLFPNVRNYSISSIEDCDCISNDKNWIPPFLCLSVLVQLLILDLLIVKFDNEFPLWDRWNARQLGLIEIFFTMDCNEIIDLG